MHHWQQQYFYTHFQLVKNQTFSVGLNRITNFEMAVLNMIHDMEMTRCCPQVLHRILYIDPKCLERNIGKLPD